HSAVFILLFMPKIKADYVALYLRTEIIGQCVIPAVFSHLNNGMRNTSNSTFPIWSFWKSFFPTNQTFSNLRSIRKADDHPYLEPAFNASFFVGKVVTMEIISSTRRLKRLLSLKLIPFDAIIHPSNKWFAA
ncbi:hypothetical protein ACNBGF_004473, partial [Escherichia coli]